MTDQEQDGHRQQSRAYEALTRAIAADPDDFDHPAYETLEALVDGRLPDADREAVESHIEVCRICAEDSADLSATGGGPRRGHDGAPDVTTRTRRGDYRRRHRGRADARRVAGRSLDVRLVVRDACDRDVCVHDVRVRDVCVHNVRVHNVRVHDVRVHDAGPSVCVSSGGPGIGITADRR